MLSLYTEDSSYLDSSGLNISTSPSKQWGGVQAGLVVLSLKVLGSLDLLGSLLGGLLDSK
jgi:hypothetical protein